jgi:PST family polysaccharide transporter
MVKLFLPLVLAGCAAAYFLVDFGIVLIGGKAYAPAARIFRYLIPVLFFSFFALLFGWPTLGAIDRNAETSRSTVYALSFQVLGLLALLLTGCYSLVAVAILRSATEAVLCGIRMLYIRKNIHAFADMGGGTA